MLVRAAGFDGADASSSVPPRARGAGASGLRRRYQRQGQCEPGPIVLTLTRMVRRLGKGALKWCSASSSGFRTAWAPACQTRSWLAVSTAEGTGMNAFSWDGRRESCCGIACDVGARSVPQKGATALSTAAARGLASMVELLLDNGADIEAKADVCRCCRRVGGAGVAAGRPLSSACC